MTMYLETLIAGVRDEVSSIIRRTVELPLEDLRWRFDIPDVLTAESIYDLILKDIKDLGMSSQMAFWTAIDPLGKRVYTRHQMNPFNPLRAPWPRSFIGHFITDMNEEVYIEFIFFGKESIKVKKEDMPRPYFRLDIITEKFYITTSNVGRDPVVRVRLTKVSDIGVVKEWWDKASKKEK